MIKNTVKRDEDLLIGLTHRFRCISAELAATYFVPDDIVTKAKRWLARLEKQGFVRSRVVFAKRIPRLQRPLTTWLPGDDVPDFGPLSYKLKNRFQSAARSTRIYIAAALSEKRFGGSSERWPRTSESTHDLGLTQVYLELTRNSPERSNGWQSEARLVSGGTKSGDKLPDALIVEADGTTTVIEFGGEYSKRKLLDFHVDCERRNRGYELW